MNNLYFCGSLAFYLSFVTFLASMSTWCIQSKPLWGQTLFFISFISGWCHRTISFVLLYGGSTGLGVTPTSPSCYTALLTMILDLSLYGLKHALLMCRIYSVHLLWDLLLVTLLQVDAIGLYPERSCVEAHPEGYHTCITKLLCHPHNHKLELSLYVFHMVSIMLSWWLACL